jgi:vacuolar-type H+-ATPase subunit E/Vma4
MMASKKIKTEAKQEVLFTKEQILASKKYSNRRDVLGAILTDGKTYVLEQVDSLLEKFMKGKVK